MKTIQIFLLTVMMTTIIFAQSPAQKTEMRPSHNKFEQIEAQKVGFITRRLELTPKEAQSFWPVYNQYEDRRRMTFQQLRKIEKEVREKDLNEDEAKRYIQRINTLRDEQFSINKEMAKSLQKVISAKKLLALKLSENDFRRKVVRGMKCHGEHHDREKQPKTMR